VLYISGEESAAQIKMRADRLGVPPLDDLHVLAETELSQIAAQLLRGKPAWAVVDSIQAVYHGELTSAPGSVSQVREGTSVLVRLAKEHGIAICVIGHVTKEGAIAGPRVLEHMVDTVLYFEGERFRTHRLLRAVKNRFGSTNEVGLFEMREQGLVEVTNPSEVFLAQRPADTPGSAVVVTVEGTRPLLLEVQALVSPTGLAMPRRAATGFDYNRLIQILAVLEKRVGLSLAKHDVHVNVVGGLTIDEPAADLAVAMACVSSARDVPIDPHAVFLGEIGLGGEVRAVGQLEWRVREAAKLGFRRALVPEYSRKGLPRVAGIEVSGVTRVVDTLVKAFEAATGRKAKADDRGETR
jgi:DNA repair protein RadA/Sms